jgi:hypothetical protein
LKRHILTRGDTKKGYKELWLTEDRIFWGESLELFSASGFEITFARPKLEI